ncbi:DapH/DapD/GlmU-related protein [Amnibacterium soli]|uniref:DapH/DapD/GlmU-related protein n=1 Tax=Amnibacterium soli TaxID=1282736 RepID=A0ABP8ZDH3_9MICO
MADEAHRVPVIDLSKAPGAGEAWDRPAPVIALWMLAEALLVTNPLQVSSSVRVQVLRAFGARIGRGTIVRPRVRVKFPWKLEIGDRSWIGEGVWFHNQDRIVVGADVVISQETFLTTGSHRVRRDMGLVTRPIRIEDGAWLTSRCMVLGGSRIGRSAVARPMTVVQGEVGANDVVSGPDCTVVGVRFTASPEGRGRA